MSSFGPDKVILPSGTTANRPASPSNGLMRYNTTLNAVEMYSSQGWIIGGDTPGSITNPAQTGQEIYDAGSTTSGLYWFAGDTYGAGDGNQFQMYVTQDQGGGWINLTKASFGPYGTILSSGFGTGGSDILAGGVTADVFNAIACSNSIQAQATQVGCPGQGQMAYVNLQSAFATDFSISEVRLKITYVSDDNAVTCGPYFTSVMNGRTIISGTAVQVDTVCANPPNRYSDRNGTPPYTIEIFGSLLSVTRIVQAWTACGGSYTMKLDQLWVR